MKSAVAIALDYRPSRWLLAAMAAALFLACMAIVLSGMPTWLKSVCIVFAGSCFGLAVGRFLHPLARRAVWQPAAHWRVTDTDGVEHVAEFAGSAVRGAWIVLRLRRSDGKRLVLVLGPDNCDAETRRQLRVRLMRVEAGT
ncbi:MAG: hypothetical protein JSS28_02060 [Proteobacteria bacterium]|nr:hypothetical protein [Pseudomonadota bacterium]